jgi:hypothetical protein
MTLTERAITIQALKAQLHEYESIHPSCTNCTSLQNNVCQYFSASPPPEWIKGPVECEQWTYDGIPF